MSNKDKDNVTKCILKSPASGDNESCNIPDCCFKKAELLVLLLSVILSALSVIATFNIAKNVDERENKSETINCRKEIIQSFTSINKSIVNVRNIIQRTLSSERVDGVKLNMYVDSYFDIDRQIFENPICPKNFLAPYDHFFNEVRELQLNLQERKINQSELMERVSGLDDMYDSLDNINVIIHECCHFGS